MNELEAKSYLRKLGGTNNNYSDYDCMLKELHQAIG